MTGIDSEVEGNLTGIELLQLIAFYLQGTERMSLERILPPARDTRKSCLAVGRWSRRYSRVIWQVVPLGVNEFNNLVNQFLG